MDRAIKVLFILGAAGLWLLAWLAVLGAFGVYGQHDAMMRCVVVWSGLVFLVIGLSGLVLSILTRK
jgi:hypothetical protein